MELQDLKQTEWYRERPTVIQNAIDLLPPTKLYRFKDSKKQCQLISYEEPKSNKLEDVTVTVQKTGVGGAMVEMGLGGLDNNKVFGVKLTDLEEWTD